MQSLANPIALLQSQRGHLFIWVPVLLALGIGLYFDLPVEPGAAAYAVIGIAVLALLAAARWLSVLWQPVFIALVMVLIGLLLAGARAHLLAAPVISYSYYGPIQGRVVKIDRSSSDKMRLTLDQVVLRNTAVNRRPERVRISLHAPREFITPELGMVVMTTGHLSPPQGPAEPGGFDFRRMAWFQQIGAVGYSRVPLLLLEPARPGQTRLLVNQLRMAVSAGVQNIVPGDAGAFAAAITTGDRSGMRQSVLRDLRASNLAHLLAISGLHMGLLTTFVFTALRYGLALVPGLNLRWPTRKIAALGALVVAGFYLLLSGGNIATERAFIMVAVMLVAILLNRRALSLRSVALAAIIVLIRRPEALTGPGFQMSFAATTALVVVFSWLSNHPWGRMPKLLQPVFTVLVSSCVAGAATAPVAAAHFNQLAHYGVLANMLTVPLMGVLVIPAAVLAALLYPLGLAWVGLSLVGWGAMWILAVAHWVASMQGAISHVVMPMPLVLPLMALGMLWLILWQGRLRFAGIAVALLGLGLWGQSQRPEVLIAPGGGLIGVLGEEGRSLNKPRGDGFAAQSWLENDGDGDTDQARAFARGGFSGEKGQLWFELGGQRFAHISGRGAARRLDQACAVSDWVITSLKAEIQGPCRSLTPRKLRDTGAVAFRRVGEGVQMVSAHDLTGRRLWYGDWREW
ncbi:MAG: competence protein [Rhodobacterales bacterium]|nr:MAG: competence protein [Rhodobacterales bacterium]